MVLVCCPPCEGEMSLHTIWLDSGAWWLPWAGSQITRADRVVFNPQQKLHIPDSVSPELEEQGRVGLDLLQWVEPDLALSPEGIGRQQPRVPQGHRRHGHEAIELGIA